MTLQNSTTIFGNIDRLSPTFATKAQGRTRIALTLVCFSALLSGCDGSAIQIFGSEDPDVYELELDDTIGPIDDASTDIGLESYFPGDDDVDENGVLVSEPEIGAARRADPIYKQQGAWTRAFTWPISPIHMALLPDGSVLTYGTNADAQNATGFTFDRWFRWRGRSSRSHETSPTGIESNLFCSAQTMLADGNVLISGGDGNQVDDQTLKNDAIDSTTLYDYRSDVLLNGNKMNYPRWYPTLVTLSDGKQLVLGGREYRNQTPAGTNDISIPPTPEVFDPDTGEWTLLNGAKNQGFYNRSWYYPRAFLRDNGKVVVADHNQDKLFELSTQGNGSFTNIGSFPGSFGEPNSPAVMFAPGKVLFAAKNGRAEVMDISSAAVTVEQTASTNVNRTWADATVLANGEVFLSGGIKTGAADNTGNYPGEIWNPQTGQWTPTAKAKKARLYHSTAILLPNAKVLTAGGGPPGPVINLNAEIYIPPYLFNDDGSIAVRPQINEVGDIDYNTGFNVVLKNNTSISKVSLVRAGSATHNFDQGQRFMELKFAQSGSVLDITAPKNANHAPPGLYMLFVLNESGVPSHAKLVMLGDNI